MSAVNVWELVQDERVRKTGHLSAEMIYDWATKQADISTGYERGDIPPTSASENGRNLKEKLLMIARTTMAQSTMDSKTIEKRMAQLDKHLEDPGLAENFRYFDVASSDFMLQFYFAMWDRRIAELMCYLHNHGKDLSGSMRTVPENDVWHVMSQFEGMNLNERKKSQNVVDFIRRHQIKRATSFGGGNIPERFYRLPEDLHLTVFDDGPVSPIEELFPHKLERMVIDYIHQSLREAPKRVDLIGTQDLVWMHGVSMYLNEKERHEMAGAIFCGMALLKPNGYMKYDYLIWNESLRRALKTQGWPYDPRNPMVIFNTVNDAIEQGRKTIVDVNEMMSNKAFLVTHDPEVTFVEPWGAMSVRFTVQKHII